MKVGNPRLCLASALLGATFAVAAGTVPNWLTDILMVRSAQTQVVRHPIDKTLYYLCWTDGTDRYGLWFRKSSLDRKLRGIPQGGRTRMSNLLSVTGSSWTASDEKICWGS